STSHGGRPHSWRLDDQARQIGRKGIVDARAALTQARRRGEAPTPGATTKRGAPPGARDRPAA
ncbi:MAG: hypothetical protein ACRD0W_06960, partial [Acidimicrobiales bacterium]